MLVLRRVVHGVAEQRPLLHNVPSWTARTEAATSVPGLWDLDRAAPFRRQVLLAHLSPSSLANRQFVGMMSIKRLLAGESYRYLLRTVADGETAGLDVSSPMTRYYTEAGTPPGTWIGSGLAGLAGGQGLATGSRVTAEQMAALFRGGQDPVNGDRLTRQSMATRSVADRIRARIAAIPDDLDRDEWRRQAALIEKVETERTARRPVSGFDLTFSPAKSVSLLWALADPVTRQQVLQAHHAAVADVLAMIERDVARTRIGSQGVAQVETRGIIAAAFDHYESRAGDPQLHTHVVIANRVQTRDGRWRTLDSHGALFPAVVALSETYDVFLADHLTRTLGVAWEARGTPRKEKNQRWELAGVPEDLIAEFSQRAGAIHDDAERRIDAWTTEHGHRPDDTTILRLRQQATIDTRPDKQLHSLHELTQAWRDRAARLIGRGLDAWVDGVIHRTPAHAVCSVPSAQEIDIYAEAVLARLEGERSTWRRWNIHAEAARATMGRRVATSYDRGRLLERVVTEVERRSVNLTPRSPVPVVAAFVSTDGSSAFDAVNSQVFSSATLLDAEARLLAAGRSLAGPTVPLAVGAPRPIDGLADDQATAVLAIATSGRELDLLVGPAGSGKTAALAELRRLWEADHGAGSVMGLAPSASAAQVLADNLGIPTDNTAKWLTEAAAMTRRLEHADQLDRLARQFETRGLASVAVTVRRQAAGLREEAERWSLRRKQLVIIDEASLAGTLDLDAIAQQAHAVDAKLLLVGDWGQLSAVQAGGAFGLLVRDRPSIPELTSVRRFTHAWERDASARLRVGDATVIAEYQQHGAINEGERSDMLDAAYAAWSMDEASGLRSLLISGDHATVQELNARARQDRVLAGTVEPDGVLLHDGSLAGEGDRVVARRNERRLSTGRGWVKNGDQFDVLARQPDGSLVVRGTSRATLVLPAAYVSEDLELAYATTAHRAQGMTVASAHLLVTGTGMTREVLYVGMSRGRQRNSAYVVTDLPVEEHKAPDGAPAPSGAEVLARVLGRTSAELSAHETARAEHERQRTIAVLAAQYETIAARAEDERWSRLLGEAGATPRTAVLGSDAHRALLAALRYADAIGLDVDTALPQLAATRPLPVGVDEGLTELTSRTERWIAAAAGDRTPQSCRFIAGLIPAAVRVDDRITAAALQHAEMLIETRAEELVALANQSGAPWLVALGPRGDDPSHQAAWEARARTVAAYRERYGVLDPTHPLGESPGMTLRQRQDHGRAARAIDDGRLAAWAVRTVAPPRTAQVKRDAAGSLGV